LKYETAGHPITGLKWTRKTTEKVSVQLKAIGIDVSSNTVCRLLKEMGYSLRVNSKKLAGVANPPDPEKRNQ
jgi:transposase